jgi:HEAT repeat protein
LFFLPSSNNSDTRELEPLIAALRHEKTDVRERAAFDLGRLGDTHAVEPLIAALEDKESDVREAAAMALGELGDARAIEPLITALDDEDRFVVEHATRALGELGDHRAVEPLIAVLGDESRASSHSCAAEALRQLGDSRAVEPLITALEEEDFVVRYVAASVLGALGDPRAVEPLKAALSDEHDDVRRRTAYALAELGDPSARNSREQVALKFLKEAARPYNLQHVTWSQSELFEAIHELGRLRSRRAIEPLIKYIFEASNFDMQTAASNALIAIGEPALEQLTTTLGEEKKFSIGGGERNFLQQAVWGIEAGQEIDYGEM